MKKFLITIFVSFVFVSLFAQNNNFSYQAIVRDNNNYLIVNQTIGVKLSLIRDIPNGVSDYVETHAVPTNANGLMTLMVGNGTVISGSLSAIDWSNHTYYLKSEIDPVGGTNYSIIGIQVISAVPFAQYAANGNYTEIQVISISNDTIFLTGGTNSFVKLPVVNIHIPDSISSYINDVGYFTSDSIPTNVTYFNNDAGYITSYVDSQQISISGDTLKLERGGSVILSPSCCNLIDSVQERTDSLNHYIDSLNGIIAILKSAVCQSKIVTNNISAIYNDTAICGGYATSPCGIFVSERGVCWNTTGTATLTDNHTSDGSGVGNFTSVLTGLSLNTYYVRAYLISENDTIYGNEVTFVTMGPPVVTTTPASSITKTTAVAGGNVTSDGGASVIQRGVCYSTSQAPTMADNYTSEAGGNGVFISNMTNLLPTTTYYIRAYAINSVDTVYGQEETFTTTDACDGVLSVTDIDNNNYGVVAIGTQCWMRENLRTTRQPNGTTISNGLYEDWCDEYIEEDGYYYWDEYEHGWVFGNCCDSMSMRENNWGQVYQWKNAGWHDHCLWYHYNECEAVQDINGNYKCNCSLYSDHYFAYPNYNEYNLISIDTYGLLYNWPAAMNGMFSEGAQGICPAGWHIPTQDEYVTLRSYAGSVSSCNNYWLNTAKALASQSNWTTSTKACAIGNNLGDNNALGFSAEPAGNAGGHVGDEVTYWLSTYPLVYSGPLCFIMRYNSTMAASISSYIDSYHSVRCIKD